MKCRADKKQNSVTGDKPKEVTKDKPGDEASELMGVWDSTGTEQEVKVMQWDSGNLHSSRGHDARGGCQDQEGPQAHEVF